MRFGPRRRTVSLRVDLIRKYRRLTGSRTLKLRWKECSPIRFNPLPVCVYMYVCVGGGRGRGWMIDLHQVIHLIN